MTFILYPLITGRPGFLRKARPRLPAKVRMSTRTRWLATAAALLIVLAAPRASSAQVEFDNNFKFSSGQDVQPVFEGWSYSPDGGFAMHFGYLNRNWVQELSIAVGPANSIEPGGPDRGQPTFFYTRTNRNLFTVIVPKDWGKKEVVWTVTANGKTQKAIGWLQPEWEIDPAGGAQTGGRQDPEFLKNKAPAITIGPVSAVALASPLTLTATVIDDGLPKPAAVRKAAVGQETPPLLQGGTTDVPSNVPQIPPAPAGGGGRGGGPQGPTVTWIIWRGPAGATFTPRTGPVKDGQAQTTVVFARAGDYVLRARASDRVLTTHRDVTVTVK
jgi:hypothetical protein